jgi:plasmid maintenance system killer protein
MTVKELKEKLNGFNENLEVIENEIKQLDSVQQSQDIRDLIQMRKEELEELKDELENL